MQFRYIKKLKIYLIFLSQKHLIFGKKCIVQIYKTAKINIIDK